MRIENPRTIEIDRFVPRAQIDPAYYNTPYFIAPRNQFGEEAFAVIREALAGKEVLAMGRVVLANRERPIIIEPSGKGLRGFTLRYSHELRSPSSYFADIPDLDLPKEMVSLAEHIVDAMLARFDPAYLEDRYRTVMLAMLRDKQPELPKRPDALSAAKVINLMDTLRRSLAAQRASPRRRTGKPVSARAAAAAKSSTAKRSAARRSR